MKKVNRRAYVLIVCETCKKEFLHFTRFRQKTGKRFCEDCIRKKENERSKLRQRKLREKRKNSVD